MRSTVVVVLGLLGLAFIGFGAPTAEAASVEAKQADSFVESIGVNVHLTYSDTAYDNFPKVSQSLQELGVRYIRDGVGLGRPDVYAEYRQLAAAGIKLDLIVGDPQQRYGVGSLQQQLNMIEANFPEAVATLEGPNEYDNQGDPNWVTNLRNYVRETWEEVNARPILASKPIIGPSMVRTEDRTLAGDLSQWTDQGNMHPYPGGQMPDLESHAISELSLAAKNTGLQPVEATETGYQNAVNETEAGNRPVSEKAAGIYTPRMFLDNFRRGIVRTYDYQLVDGEADPTLTEPEDAFGLLRNDWTPKPAYTSLQRLIKLIEDPGPSFTPQPLDFSIANAPASERQVLLERRDGTYDLVIWNAVSVWNTTSLTELTPSSPTVSVQFEQPIEKVEAFRPNESANAVGASSAQTLSMSLSPSVTVLHVVPKAAEPPAPGGPEPLMPNSAAGTPPSASAPVVGVEVAPVVEGAGKPAMPAVESPAAPESTTTADTTTTTTSSSTVATTVSTPAARAKLRRIERQVHAGCAHGCPLTGAELRAAKAVLRRGHGKGAAGDRRVAQAASWLKQRQSTLAGEGDLKGRHLLRYLTIDMVLKSAGQASAA